MHAKLATAVAGTCLLFAIACAPVFAEGPIWELNKEPVVEKTSVTSRVVEMFRIEDMKTVTGAVAVECRGSDEGNVSTSGKGEIIKFTTTECKPSTGGCGAGTIKVTALHLPWKTQLEGPGETGAYFLDKMSSGESVPGWKMECTILGITFVDECTKEATHLLQAGSGGVDTLFETELEAEALNCSVGGSGQGLVSATDLLENPGGRELDISSCFAGFPCFELLNPGGAFTKTGEKRTIEVRNIVIAGKPSGLGAAFTREGFFTVNDAEVETCRKLTYALNQVCTFEIAYVKKTGVSEPAVRLKILVTFGLEPKNELVFSG
jgi:hypothetical protein